MSKGCWLVKLEPADYAWASFVKDGHAAWTACVISRTQPPAIDAKTRPGLLLSQREEKQVVGLARVEKEAYPTPRHRRRLVGRGPVAGEAASETRDAGRRQGRPDLRTMPLVRQSRLSVSPVTEAQFKRLLELGRDEDLVPSPRDALHDQAENSAARRRRRHNTTRLLSLLRLLAPSL